MSAYQLHRLFRPRRVVLIGASDRAGSLGTMIASGLLGGDPQSVIDFVNPAHDEVHGQACHRRIADLPETPDLALIVSPWPGIPAVCSELADIGCPGALVCSVADEQHGVWFSSRRALRQLGELCRTRGFRLIGPSSQGLLLPALGLYGALCPNKPSAGRVALVSQSGGMLNAVAAWATGQGLGLSMAVALGDEIDVDVADCLDYLAADTTTQAVLVYLESIPRARKLYSAMRECSFRKPVIVLRPRSLNEAEAAGFSDAANDAACSALFRRAGALRVRGLPQFFAAANAEFSGWTELADTLAVAGNGYSLAALAVDAVRHYGARLAHPADQTLAGLSELLGGNTVPGLPMDLRRDADPERYADAARLLAADKAVQAIVLTHQPTPYCDAGALAGALARIEALDARLMAVFVGGVPSAQRSLLHQAGIPAFDSPEQALRAHALHCHYRQLKESLRETPPPTPARQRDWVRVAALLSRLRQSRSRTGLWPAILASAGLAGVPIEACAPGNSLRIGLRRHPELGALLWARNADAEAYDLPPLNVLNARRLLEQVHPGSAAGPEASSELLLACLDTLSELACRHTDVASLTLVPCALDGIPGPTLLVEGSLDGAALPTAIRPRPSDLDEDILLGDGRRLCLRPIQAEDEPELQAGFNRLSAEEIRLRFLYPLKAMTHALAARLTQIDYERELALVLAEPGPAGLAPLYGVVRAVMDPASKRAEYAIVIHRSLTGLGLGQRMMQRIMDCCRARGMQEVYGDVLAQNAAMLTLCRKLGFELNADPEEPGLIQVRKALQGRAQGA